MLPFFVCQWERRTLSLVRGPVEEGRLVYLDVCDPEVDIRKQLIYHRKKWISNRLRAFIEYAKKAEFSD